MKLNTVASLLAACLLSASLSAEAAPVDVSYTVSGSAGDWTLDFSLTNNLGVAQDLYFFGVQLGTHAISASPAGFDPSVWPTWTNTGFGGSSTAYNNNWIDFSYGAGPGNGQTISGFEVHLTDANAPTSVAWFTYGYGYGVPYEGGGNFNVDWNPGFEGVAVPVPEPGSVVLMLAGLGAFALRRRASRA